MTAPTLKSRPIYSGLKPRPGPTHLFVVDENGAQAAVDLGRTVPREFWDKAHVIFVPSTHPCADADKALCQAAVSRLNALLPRSMHASPSFPAAVPRIQHVLARAVMGTNLYLAGTEGLIGQAMQLALDAGMEAECILTEHRGSLMRRVQCVHCKGITENVSTQPVTCSHCGLTLFVRDHYSRRIGAFQGVAIDAEEPGVVPPTEEAFR